MDASASAVPFFTPPNHSSTSLLMFSPATSISPQSSVCTLDPLPALRPWIFSRVSGRGGRAATTPGVQEPCLFASQETHPVEVPLCSSLVAFPPANILCASSLLLGTSSVSGHSFNLSSSSPSKVPRFEILVLFLQDLTVHNYQWLYETFINHHGPRTT
jgi:hypothetical protein